MVRLNLEGIWIDLNDQEFELKWKHPIQNSLKGENSTYSTDITCALTENNRLAFDYKIFTSSSKTNRYLYGVLYVNDTAMRVRCYIKGFSLTSVKFYLEQFIQGAVSNLLKDETNICDLYLTEIQNQSKRDVLYEVTNIPATPKYPFAYVPGVDLPDIFTRLSANDRPNIYATNLIQELAAFYGVTLNNAPTNYLVYSNQWKCRSGIAAKAKTTTQVFNTIGCNQILHGFSTPQFNLWFELSTVKSVAPFKIFLKFQNIFYHGVISEITAPLIVYLYLKNTATNAETLIKSITYTPTSSTWAGVVIESPVVPAGDYILIAKNQSKVTFTCYSDVPTIEAMICYTNSEKETEKFSEYADFGVAGYYPCWQNLPDVTAKTLIETVALCAGKMVEYKDNSIDFIDFDQIFDWNNAIDVSDKLISMKEKSFRFLNSNNATVGYSNGAVIATVLINDETLPIGTNNVATIDALRIQDDTGEERTTDKVVLQQLPDGHFEIINKLADIYTPVINPKVFEADFIYFSDNKKPLLIRQFGGIFIALESVMTTKNTITLKLLKLR